MFLYPDVLGTDQIRLLEVVHGEENGPIHLGLRTVLLSDSTEYDALSYTWDSDLPDDARESAQINGVEVEIKANLAGALRELRRQSVKRELWIDAICINQNNLQERNNQVRIMDQIYNKASCVLVWLGTADGDTELVWHAIEQIAAQHSACVSLFDRPSETNIDFENYLKSVKEVQNLLPPGDSLEIAALSRFLGRKWFSRAWTYQEVILSRHCAIMCGSFRKSWDIFEKIFMTLHVGSYWAMRQGAITNFRNIAISFGYRQAISRDVSRTEWVSAPEDGLSFSQFLLYGLARHAADQRDKVFAFLGLRPTQEIPLYADYSMSLEDTYIAAGMACFLSEGLFLLSCAGRPAQDLHLPTWAPDLRKQPRNDWYLSAVPMGHTEPISNASAPHKWSPQLRDRILSSTFGPKFHIKDDMKRLLTNELVLPGVFLTRIDTLIDPSVLGFSKSTEGSSGYLNYVLVRGKAVAAGIPQLLLTGSPYQSDFELMTVCNFDPFGFARRRVRFDPYRMPAAWKWKEEGCPEPVPKEVDAEYAWRRGNVFRFRLIFLAEGGKYFGIVPDNAQVGDTICVLLGGTVPYVLRQNSRDAGRAVEGRWQFIGESLVQNYMHGEALSESPNRHIIDFRIV